MQLNKLAMITGLALVKAEDPIPDHVPTLDERNERDYQSAYAQVEREWRRDVGLHDYQPVFAQVCAVMNLIGVEHLNHEYNRGDPSTQTQPLGKCKTWLIMLIGSLIWLMPHASALILCRRTPLWNGCQKWLLRRVRVS